MNKQLKLEHEIETESEQSIKQRLLHYTGVVLFYTSLFFAVTFLSQHFSELNYLESKIPMVVIEKK